jgi:hypothetical protein
MSAPTAANGSGKVSLQGVCPARRAVEHRLKRGPQSEAGEVIVAPALRWPIKLNASPNGRTYLMVRLACDLCPRRDKYRKDTLIARFGGDVLTPH